MKKIDILTTYSLVIGVTSAVFMLWVFLNEMFGHGVLFYEPNVFMATGEFFACLVGLVMLAFLMVASITPKSKDTERTGYETGNKGAYQ